jgi:hypothetical protein
MGDRRLLRIQDLCRRSCVRLSEHVMDRIDDGEFEETDVYLSISYGCIVAAQRDGAERKYVIRGPSKSGLAFETVGKFVQGFDGQEYFLITAYLVRGS